MTDTHPPTPSFFLLGINPLASQQTSYHSAPLPPINTFKDPAASPTSSNPPVYPPHTYPDTQALDPSLREPPGGAQASSSYPTSGNYDPTQYVNPQLASTSAATPGPTSGSALGAPGEGPTYARTLVGPLIANACRLLDEKRQPGIFFLFQDLSIRTEGPWGVSLVLHLVAPIADRVY